MREIILKKRERNREKKGRREKEMKQKERDLKIQKERQVVNELAEQIRKG